MRARQDEMKPKPDIDAVMAEVLALLRECRRCDEAAEKLFGCTAAQLAVLAAISQKGELSVQALASELHLHQSSASAVARKLARDGLVRRRKAKTDKRASELSLTAEGKALATQVGATGRPMLAAALSVLTQTTTQELMRSSRHLRREMADQRAMLLRRS